MEKIIINTVRPPAVIGSFNQGIVSGNLLFTSSQLPMHPVTGEVPAGVESQTIQVMENPKAIIEAADLGMGTEVKTTICLQSVRNFANVNEICSRYFTEKASPRACVEVSEKMAKGALVGDQYHRFDPLKNTTSIQYHES